MATVRAVPSRVRRLSSRARARAVSVLGREKKGKAY
jgi:hypothetical protein